MRLQFNSFNGEIPKVHRTLLPEGFAQTSIDADHGGGVIDPIRENTLAHTPASAPVDFYLHKGETWLTFDADVDVVPGPVASDRLYISRDNAAPILKVMPAGTEYPLALPTPTAPPILAIETALEDPADETPPGAQRPYSESLSTVDFITAVYNDVLGREPDIAGLAFWEENIDADNVTWEEFILEIERHYLPPPIVDPLPRETVNFTYTWVSIFDEESLPAPPSSPLTIKEGETIRVSFVDQPPSGTRINRLRVYRTQTSGTGVSEYHFVKELNVETPAYVHDIEVDPIQELLPAAFYEPPVDGLRGLTSLQGGMVAGFAGKSLYFCEPYKPHAWPTQYELVTDYEIVALVAFGPILAILTTGQPYVVQGTAPENMIMDRIEQNAPCLSRDGVVDLGYAAAYPSTEGLVTLTQQGGQVVTRNLFSREQWRAMNPETFSAGHRMGNYVFTYEDEDGNQRAAIIDLSGQNPALIRSTTTATRIHHDIYTGKLHFIDGTAAIWEYAADDADRLRAVWESAEYLLPSLTGFGVLLVEGDAIEGQAEDMTATVYADGSAFATVSKMNEIARLPMGLSRRWSVRIMTKSIVSRVTMAGSVTEIYGR